MRKLYYVADPGEISNDLYLQILELLPEFRRKKALSYRNLLDRKLSAISYLLLMYGLYDCFGITEFRLRYGAHGKPYLLGTEHVFFNLSHCASGCVCGISDREIGVDIQDLVAFDETTAEFVCTPEELRRLHLSQNRDELFTKLWCMKESIVKLSGEGISEDFKKIDTLQRKTGTKVTKIGRQYVAFSQKI